MIGTQMNADFQDSIKPNIFSGAILHPFKQKKWYQFSLLKQHS